MWVTGSIYIGGAGVASGYYLNRTYGVPVCERPVWGDTLFRTGDLGRVRPDGQLEILGREDSQVSERLSDRAGRLSAYWRVTRRCTRQQWQCTAVRCVRTWCRHQPFARQIPKIQRSCTVYGRASHVCRHHRGVHGASALHHDR